MNTGIDRHVKAGYGCFMNTAMFAIIAATLAGCASSSPEDARNLGPDRKYSFDVAVDYQTVYRRIVDIARSCYQANLITASQIVNSDLYPGTRSGTISVGMYGISTAIYQVIDIQGDDAGTTKVTAIFPVGPIQKRGENVKAWATGSGKAC
jgi:hypothetical protein